MEKTFKLPAINSTVDVLLDNGECVEAKITNIEHLDTDPLYEYKLCLCISETGEHNDIFIPRVH